MSAGRIVRRDAAELDLIANAEFLVAEGGLDLGLRFLDSAEATIGQLSEMPLSGARRAFVAAELADVRAFAIHGFESYLVFYRSIEGGIEVLRVIHGARDLPAVLGNE